MNLSNARMFVVFARREGPEADTFICSMRGDGAERSIFVLASMVSLWSILAQATGMSDAEIFVAAARMLAQERLDSDDDDSKR